MLSLLSGSMGKEQIISLLVEDKFGVLQRIAGVFSRRGFNMNTITVGRSEKPGLSRMTITTSGSEKIVEQIMKQLSKLVETIKVSELNEEECVVREIGLIKVYVRDFAARSEIINYTQIFRGRVVDASQNSMMIEITGTPEKLDAYTELIKPFGIKELVRTGVTALLRD